jgi:TonB family protein
MIRAKEISLINIGVLLALAVGMSAAIYISGSHPISSRNLPVFMGEEVSVNNTVKAVPLANTTAAAEVKTAQRTIAEITAPKTAAPLPINPPSISFKILPVYPASALEQNLTGTVLLAVYVGPNGQAERIETKTSSGVAQLDESARAAVTQWKFSPALQGGAALASWFEVPVRFRIN